MKTNIKPAEGKLGILIPGLGAVTTTPYCRGRSFVKKGLSQPIGSLISNGKHPFR